VWGAHSCPPPLKLILVLGTGSRSLARGNRLGLQCWSPSQRRRTECPPHTSSAMLRHICRDLSGILRRGIYPIKHHPKQHQQQEEKNAAFRPHGSAGQPTWTLQRRMQQVSGSHASAVRDRIKVALAPVPGSVKANREPKVPGAS